MIRLATATLLPGACQGAAPPPLRLAAATNPEGLDHPTTNPSCVHIPALLGCIPAFSVRETPAKSRLLCCRSRARAVQAWTRGDRARPQGEPPPACRCCTSHCRCTCMPLLSHTHPHPYPFGLREALPAQLHVLCARCRGGPTACCCKARPLTSTGCSLSRPELTCLAGTSLSLYPPFITPTLELHPANLAALHNPACTPLHHLAHSLQRPAHLPRCPCCFSPLAV
jgi:hypothetical protein